MRFPRTSGLLLHVTSLPGGFAGDLGAAAIQFIDFLARGGQRVWQVLPLGPPALGSSPYSCYSAFAGNSLLISVDQMVADGWIDSASPMDAVGDRSVADFESAAAYKNPQFRVAYAQSKEKLRSDDAFNQFCQDQRAWLDDYARFEALMGYLNESDWTRWPADLVRRDSRSLERWDRELADAIEYSKFLQFVFDGQWRRVKRYANDREIKIFGDMPIFVAHESADVWANQSLFCLNELGEPTLVAGVPPDYFSETGQLWGNPLYRWDVLESTNFEWWTARFQCALQQFDLLRVDHFRGFEAYWEIPASAETAVSGHWETGPGAKPFEAAREALGELPIVAEDLGMITQEVHDLRDQLDFPAMRVLQFGFDDPDDVFHRPDHYPEKSVAYTGTHDNETIMGWYANHRQRLPDNPLLDAFVSTEKDIHLQLVRAVLQSGSDTAIVPMQDWLGLGNEARMNLPGEATGNWRWRVNAEALSDDLADQMRQMSQDAGR